MNLRNRFLLLVGVLITTGALMIGLVGPSASLDARLYYSGDEARAFLAAQSATERAAYFNNEILDLLFLTAYSSLFFLCARRLTASRAVHGMALVPGGFDLIETGFVIVILTSNEPFNILNILGVVTFAKWIFGFLFLSWIGGKLMRENLVK